LIKPKKGKGFRVLGPHSAHNARPRRLAPRLARQAALDRDRARNPLSQPSRPGWPCPWRAARSPRRGPARWRRQRWLSSGVRATQFARRAPGSHEVRAGLGGGTGFSARWCVDGEAVERGRGQRCSTTADSRWRFPMSGTCFVS
jgi:hypothetical protein